MIIFSFYNPLSFNDPVAFAVPFFIVLILFEYFLVKRNQKNYDVKEAIASIGMGLGSVFINLGSKALYVGVFFVLFKYRIFDNLAPDSFEELKQLSWHKSHWYLWVLLFFLEDLTFYVHHRLGHEVRILWAGHVNHHSSEDYNLATALRQGWWEYMYKYLLWLWLPLLGFHPIMVLTQMSLSLIYQFWIHTEYINKLGFLELFMNTPSHHRVHHGANIKYLDRNYGGILIIWDRMFGSFQAEEEKAKYGLTHNIHTRNLFKIASHELIAILKDVIKAPGLGNKLSYIFRSPGWKHDGPDERAKVLKKKYGF